MLTDWLASVFLCLKKRGDSSTEGSGPSIEENVEILVSRTQVRKDSSTAFAFLPVKNAILTCQLK